MKNYSKEIDEIEQEIVANPNLSIFIKIKIKEFRKVCKVLSDNIAMMKKYLRDK